MTEKNQKNGQPDAPREAGGHRGKRARSRRLVLKSMVAGGAVTTTRTLPEKWTRPITDSVIMPAHAQSSLPSVNLSCAVQSVSHDAPSDESGDLNFTPSGPPVSGGASITVDNFLDAPSGGNIDIQLSDVSATVDPASAGDVTLTLTPGGDFDLDTGAGPFDVTPSGTGVASFTDIEGDLSPTDSGPSMGNLALVFSAPGADDCVIDFTFEETSFNFN